MKQYRLAVGEGTSQGFLGICLTVNADSHSEAREKATKIIEKQLGGEEGFRIRWVDAPAEGDPDPDIVLYLGTYQIYVQDVTEGGEESPPLSSDADGNSGLPQDTLKE